MLTKDFNELDNDYITLWSQYLLSREKQAITYDLAKLAELGQINAQAKWYLIAGNRINDEINRQTKNMLSTTDYHQLMVNANKCYNSERFALKTLVEKLKTEDTRDAINIARCDISDLGYYQNIIKAIKTLNEMMMSGKASLLDNENYLEILNQNPLCKPEDVKDYRKVRSALAVQHIKDKSNPVYAFALALNYRTFGVNPKNMKKSNTLLQRLATRKLSKTFLEYRGPNVRVDYSVAPEKFSPVLSF